ncbi:hypothetical protein PVE_P0019 (plasmid) [Pseudomonas veronii 1YdBTEX2]|uniref:Uncharacterized protein n=2 Tax=Pseudomonas veronii TaxID=76761 RepID=A0A7Y1FBR7_PSEVE|nr:MULTISPECIES: hypothetical protein [Pseudomonas]SBW85064.1 hypothetical protein PVE_P0019 [Pseudomonas veronii 1YdBTEX2]KAA0946366.1 hypothetical protein FQ182_14525 [Pseudomonas sp. ANT_H4]MBI6552638.1 hypothetical protein [Pseudomonas veronii]MBI6652733.1 hypothetical protein [Pseudomonas veronii]NMY12546.1 hypothetical protein [Pseudomonas veronii]
MVQELKAYQLGDDIVAHYTPEKALDFLRRFCGLTDEVSIEDIELTSDVLLDTEMLEEDGTPAGTLRAHLAAATEPCYLHGPE